MSDEKKILNKEETEKKTSDSKEINMDELDEVTGGSSLRDAEKKKTEPISTRVRKNI